MNSMDFIEETNKLGSRLGLESVKDLLKRLGNPQNQLKVVHIAGTNGKGSIFAFMESVLKEAGYRVGRYISPTVFTYLERFQINGKSMEKEAFDRICEKVQSVFWEMKKEGRLLPTAFEVETAIAFLYFLEEKVDVVLLETGMGGDEDATNVVECPICHVFASISYDHMAFLGNSLSEITKKKAGILRENGKAVAYPMNEEAMGQLEKCCEEKKVRLMVADKAKTTILSQRIDGQEFCYKGENYKIPLLGEYQIYNAITALETLELIKDELYTDDIQRKKGLLKTKWPCRFEVVNKSPYVIRDGAHNLDAVRELRKTLENLFPEKKMVFVMGVFKDKEYEKMIPEIMPLSIKTFTVTAPGERGLPKEELCHQIQKGGWKAEVCKNLQEGINEAKNLAGKEGVVVIFGSLSFIGEV